MAGPEGCEMIGYIDGDGPEETAEGYLVFKQPVEGSKKVFILTEEELHKLTDKTIGYAADGLCREWSVAYMAERAIAEIEEELEQCSTE